MGKPSPSLGILFHGDPHAGNVLHVVDDPKLPYRIALIDRGLSEVFPKAQRKQLIQLLVGLTLGDPKRLANNLGALVQLEEPSPAQEQAISDLVDRVLTDKDRDSFQLLNDLITELGRQGFSIRFNAAIFIKSQLTIAGILVELDPEFKQGDYLMSRVSGQVFKETPTRLLRTVYFPAWNSHNYKTLMSNEDVKDVQAQRFGRTFKKNRKGNLGGHQRAGEAFLVAPAGTQITWSPMTQACQGLLRAPKSGGCITQPSRARPRVPARQPTPVRSPAISQADCRCRRECSVRTVPSKARGRARCLGWRAP